MSGRYKNLIFSGSLKMSEETKKWYYSFEGTAKGPCSVEEIKMAIQAQIIRKDTMVWPGAGEWIKASLSELSPFFPEELFAPPLMPSLQKVNVLEDLLKDLKSPENRIGWIYSGIFIFFIIINWMTLSLGRDGSAIVLLITGLLLFGTFFFDLKKMKKEGKPLPFVKQLSFLILPWYIWQRSAHLGLKKYPFYFFIGLTVIWTILAVSYFAPQREQAEFANEACEIARRNNYDCVKVKITETVKKGENYKAVIYLGNGNIESITISYNSKLDRVTIWGL